jgi:hypothetical protein
VFYRVVNVKSQVPLARFNDEVAALTYLQAYAKEAPDEVALLALIRFGDDGLADESWDLSDLEGSGGKLRIPEYH